MPCVFSGNYVHLAEHLARPFTEVSEIANWCGNYI